MRKLYFGIAIAACISYSASAQLSEGGLPTSMLRAVGEQYVPISSFTLPDWGSAKKLAEQDEQQGISKPYKFGLQVATDIGFPGSGTIITLENGERVWKAQIKIDGAPAIGLYYDAFELPNGVKYFISNANGNQVLGAYTVKNNFDDHLFANEAVQGGLLNLELNIDKGVDLATIKMHINSALVYFRSYEYLNQYAKEASTSARPTDEPDGLGLEGSSSTCGINAICPLGVNYPEQRKATVQTILPTGLCSATLINNTGNTGTTCKQYMLTATHCESGNSTSNTAFSQMLIRFNFERKTCGVGPAARVSTMVGANFRARANYIETSPPEINGDFLLLELKTKIPESYDAYLAGWNRATSVPSPLTYPKRYIGFHHPAGDVKKVSVSDDISPDGEAGGSSGPGTHWQIYPVDSGGIEGGSSGSGLFDGEGRLIGIASVAGDPKAGCSTNSNGDPVNFFRYVAYSKFSLGWDYTLDGTMNMRRLQPWLDPVNSGVSTLDAIKSTCPSGSVSISNTKSSAFGNSISLYPNPTKNGIVSAKVNFKEATDLTVDIYSVAGAKVQTFQIQNAVDDTYTFNLNGYANGMYLLKFTNGSEFATKKLMLSK